MLRKIALLTSFITLLFGHAEVTAQTVTSRYFNERFVIVAMARLHSAEATYQSTSGNGSFGGLADLERAGLIDPALASGHKFGYAFSVQAIAGSPAKPPGFSASAAPLVYRRSGLRSFFIDGSAELHGADKNGLPASSADPYIDSCVLWGIGDNERCTIGDMRALHGAEITYAATSGNGTFAPFPELYRAGLIRSDLADYASRGYIYQIFFPAPARGSSSGRFWIKATPAEYGVSAIRSFFIDETGVLRGADKNGQPAGADDPPVN